MDTKSSTFKPKTINKPRLGAMCKPAKCSLAIELRQKEAELKEAHLELAKHKSQINNLEEELAKTKGLLRLREQALFGTKTEKAQTTSGAADIKPVTDTALEHTSVLSDTNTKRKRGAQPGHQGHGRKIPEHLPVLTKTHEIPEDEGICPRCGKPYADSGLCEESHEITMEIQVRVVKHKRKRKFRTCDCENLPVSVTAPLPAKVIPKSMYSHLFLAYLLSFKYGFQIPLHRITLMLAQQGLIVNSGTISGIFKKLMNIFFPLYALLQVHLQNEDYLHADETGFRCFDAPGDMSFTEVASESRKRYWLWVFCGEKVVFFVVDPSRSSSVCEQTLGSELDAVLMTDGFSAYRKYVKDNDIVHSLCWTHFRRFFKNAAVSFPELKSWAEQWIARIANIYSLNRKRLEAIGESQLFATVQKELGQAIDSFYATLKKEVKEPNLHEKQFKILTSAITNWQLYTLFVNDYRIPMDNNAAERCLRAGTLGRKNWYGAHAQWSGTFAAMMMTFIQTAAKHGLNPTAYLEYILDKHAEHAGKPSNLQELLPWNITKDTAEKYSMYTDGDPP